MRFSHCNAYSFGKVPKCQLEKTDSLTNPSPCQYNPKCVNRMSSPKWKIGTEIRVKRTVNNNPGPSQYYPDRTLTLAASPKFSLKSRPKSLLEIQNDNPSPDKYNPILRSSSPKFSMGKKTLTIQTNNNPGPGAYNNADNRIVVKRVPSYKFSKSTKEGLNTSISNTPSNIGPGTYYNTEYNNPISKTPPKYSFGKARREESKVNASPSPGQYEIKQYIGKEGPKISMGKKLRSCKSESSYPGPGSYNLTDNSRFKFNKTKAYKFGKEERSDEFYRTINTNPGPDKYYPETTFKKLKDKSPSWSLKGTGQRSPIKTASDNNIGPGNYDIPNTVGKGGPKFSMARKINFETCKTQTPGPSYYSVNTSLNFKKSPSFKMGTSTRDDRLKNIIKENVPAPNAYDPNFKNKDSSPNCVFGTGKKQDEIVSDTPGPAAYHIPCSIVDVNDYTRESGNFDENYRYI